MHWEIGYRLNAEVVFPFNHPYKTAGIFLTGAQASDAIKRLRRDFPEAEWRVLFCKE